MYYTCTYILPACLRYILVRRFALKLSVTPSHIAPDISISPFIGMPGCHWQSALTCGNTRNVAMRVLLAATRYFS